MSVDFSIFYKRCLGSSFGRELPQVDIFVSAFTRNERVQSVFREIRATRKVWLIHPEYRFTAIELPTGDELVAPTATHEFHQIAALMATLGDLTGLAVCIDATGLMRHALVFLMATLQHHGVRAVTVLYSEPDSYLKQEATHFTLGSAGVVRPVAGMAGSNVSSGKDHVIVAVGYDHLAVGEVLNTKDSATVHPIFGFPSLSADMYQQSALRAARSGDKALEHQWVTNRRFAPASDPFATAEVVREIVNGIDRVGVAANIYLTPLSTKAQALGFALYWLWEGRNRDAVTLLLPECLEYAPDTSVGLRRVWQFEVELP